MKLSHLLPFVTAALSISAVSAAFVHPGLLHTDADLTRVTEKVNASAEPWLTGWNKLISSNYAQPSYTAHPAEILCRGAPASCDQDYVNMYSDAAAAYALAIRWRVTGEAEYGDAAARIVNGWTSTMKEISGNSDKYLASGLYGYQLANAGEILRDFDGFTDANMTSLVDLLVNVFYPMNHLFFEKHNGAKVDHYWANWDLCNLATMISTGVIADNQAIFDEAVDYFYNGVGNGAIDKTVWILYDDGTGQVQESGRDQGHTTLDIGLLGVIAQTAYNQGVNLFTYQNARILAGAEYVAKYNLGNDVQYTTYVNSDVTQTEISSGSRGNIRPIWDLLYNHYVKIEGMNATYTTQYAELVRSDGGGADGGGGYYGTTSGGFDQLGYNTLMFTV